jgi:predicted negative regulator of RcsB-dependent stress response
LGLCETGDLTDAIPALEAAVDTVEDNPVQTAWLAKAYFRDRQYDRAAQTANRAVSDRTCNAFAFTVRGDVTNPQFVNKSDRDPADVQRDYRKAVACDPDAGIAWMSIWPMAAQQGDTTAAERAIERLHDLQFFTPPVRTMARWILATVPPDALLLTNGDADTYPLLGLQQIGGRRTDVAIVNASLLNLPGYVEYVTDRYELPPPMSSDSLRAFRPYRADDGDIISLSKAVVASWYTMQGQDELERPLVGAPTLTPSVFDALDRLQWASLGAYIHTDPDVPPLNASSRITRAILALEARDLEGPLMSSHDLTCRRVPPGFRTAIPYYALTYANLLIDQNRPASAARILQWAKDIRTDIAFDDETEQLFQRVSDRLVG